MPNLRPPYPNELYHHGIKGMSWGVQNGPPYPLDRQTHNKVVKSDYRNAKRELRNTAYHVLKTTKEANKANRGRDAAKAKDAEQTKVFYKEQYKQALKTYKQAAAAAGKNPSKYSDSKLSLNKQAFLAGKPELALFGNQSVASSLIANKINNNYLRDWARQKETSAKFDRYKNQKQMALKADSNKGIKNGSIINEKSARTSYYKAAKANGLNEKTARWLAKNATNDALLMLAEPKVLNSYMKQAKNIYE